MPDDPRRCELLAAFADDLRAAGGGPKYCTPLSWPWNGHIPGYMWVDWEDLFSAFGVDPEAVTEYDARAADRIEAPNVYEVLFALERRRQARERS